MWIKKRFRLEEAAEACGVEITSVVEWVENKWVEPVEPQERIFDEEDVARMRLIQKLRIDFGVNDEAVPIILSLLDQIHHLHYRLRSEPDHDSTEESP